MKKSHYLVLLLLIVSLFTACKKNNTPYAKEYQESYRSWLGFKESSGNSYRYTVYFGSWAGSTSQTVITVKSGKVTRRSYELKIPDQNSNVLILRNKWEEDETTLNTNGYGAAAVTLDAIYEKAKTDWLQERKDATPYLETKNNGMISSCGYSLKNCNDDCFVGINITLIEQL
jgi:hypothetical protein